MLAHLPTVPVVVETQACVGDEGADTCVFGEAGLEAWLLKIAVVFPVCSEHP